MGMALLAARISKIPAEWSDRELLKFVLRDGFDAVEVDIHESLAAMRDIELHGTVPHAEVMRGANSLYRSLVVVTLPRRFVAI